MKTPPKSRKTRKGSSLRRMVQFRWLIVTWATEHWDDRDKEYYTNSGERAPKLQWLNGKVWRDVPTVRISEKKLNEKLNDSGPATGGN